MSYSLLDEPWIPVLWQDGTYGRAGIIRVLREAGHIRQIAASNPMDRVAALRFLLALLYWCRGNPPEPTEVPTDGFPDAWLVRLRDERECFDLLGEGRRFYQDPSARRRRPATDLLQEVPAGNNAWHFRHATDYENGLCSSCCAMGLLRLPMFSVSGLPDLKAGINGTPPIYVVPCGSSLQETLCLNWSVRDVLGDPAWVNPLIRPPHGQAVALLLGLTLLSRRVWLHEPEAASCPCIGCGARGATLTMGCEFQTAGEQMNDLWDDPHVVFLDGSSRKSIKAPDLTASGRLRMDRPWASLLSQASTSKALATATVHITALATDKAKYVDVWEHGVSLPITASTPSEESVAAIGRWQGHGGDLARRCIRIILPPQAAKAGTDHTEITSTLAAIRPQVEDRVSARVGELLSGGEAAWERAADEYAPMMAAVARSLSPGVTTEAVRRREALAVAKPDMRPRAVPTPKRKEGGKQ